MICKNCETLLENEGARFCPKCGAAIGDSFSPPAVGNDFLSARADGTVSASDTLSSESEKSISDEDASADFAASKEFSADEAEDVVENINETDGIHAEADATNDRSYAEVDAKMSVGSEKSVGIKPINEEASIETENVGQGNVSNDAITKIADADTKQSDSTSNKVNVIEQNTYANSYEHSFSGKSKTLKIPDFITRHYIRKTAIYTPIVVISILIAIYFRVISLAVADQEGVSLILGLVVWAFAILAICFIFPAARTWMFFIAPTKSRLCRKLAEFGDVAELLKQCGESFERKRFRGDSRIDMNSKFIILFQPSYVFVAPIEATTRGCLEEIATSRYRAVWVDFTYRLRLAFSNGSIEKVKVRGGVAGDNALKNIKNLNQYFKIGKPRFLTGFFFGFVAHDAGGHRYRSEYMAHITSRPKPQPRQVKKPKTKKCPKCSADIEKDSVFCKSCGVNVRELNDQK